MALTTCVLLSSVIPLLRESVGVLMQRTPPQLEGALPQCYQRVSLGLRPQAVLLPHARPLSVEKTVMQRLCGGTSVFEEEKSHVARA